MNLVAVPAGMSDATAVVLADNAPTAWYGVRKVEVGPGDTVAVLGLGLVGLMAVQSALARGADRVFGVDVLADRLDLAERAGAIPVAAGNAKLELRSATHGAGVDAVVECVGADSTIDLALRVVRTEGRVSVLGVSANRAYPLDLAMSQRRRLQFTIGLASMQQEIAELMKLPPSASIDYKLPVSDTFDLADGQAAYELATAWRPGVMKVLLTTASGSSS